MNKIGDIENFNKLHFPYKFVSSSTLSYIGPTPDKKYWNNEYVPLEEISEFWDLKKKTIAYCERDVLILKKAMLSLILVINEESKNILSRNFSTPSIAHSLFFYKYNSKNIDKSILLKYSNYIRAAYFGGRCEVFGNIYDNEHIKYYDFSGMYGQCMLENFHIGEFFFDVPNKIDLPGFYTIRYISKEIDIPVLPQKINNKLIFSNGEKTGTYWYEEIINFIEKGGIVYEIKHALLTKKKDKIFTEFVYKFKKMREKGNYYNIFGKLMINSLYGSLALNEKETCTIVITGEEEFRKKLEKYTVEKFYTINTYYILIITIDHKYKKNVKKRLYTKRNISYACAISSKARIKLNNLFSLIQKDGGRILYCDTDSAFAAYSNTDFRKNVSTVEWLNFYKDGVFSLPKSYAVLDYDNSYEIKLKGYKNTKINFNEFKTCFYESKSINIENQLVFKKSDFILKELYTNKFLDFSNYSKRIFSENKKTTKALTINTPL